jgi:hypothetical protein
VHIDCCTLDDWWAKLHSIYNLVLNLYSLQYNWNTIYKNYSEYFQTNFRALATIYIHCTHFISHSKQIQYTKSDNINDMAFCLFGFILQLGHPAWNLQTEIDWPECAFHSLHARYILREVSKLLVYWHEITQKEVISVTTVSLCLNWLSYTVCIFTEYNFKNMMLTVYKTCQVSHFNMDFGPQS